MTVDLLAQHQAMELTPIMEREASEVLYHAFYMTLHEKMDKYYCALCCVRQLEMHTMKEQKI